MANALSEADVDEAHRHLLTEMAPVAHDLSEFTFGFAVAVFRRYFGEELTMTLVAPVKDASDIDDLRFPFLARPAERLTKTRLRAAGQQLPTAELGYRGSIRETRPSGIERRDSLDASSMETALQTFVESHQRLFVLTGAGCSTNSGIPDYRDGDGNWKRTQPVRFQAFMADEATRRRYWARSVIGWRRFGRALPNDAHHALARLENQGRCRLLLTQNVDRLHQAAGSRAVIDLHGRLDLVRCTACLATTRRADFQNDLARLNAEWTDLDASSLPDGDADLDHLDFSGFAVPACGSCGGIQKPDVVFFGENVPRDQVAAAQAALEEADAMLVVGSSLMVYSGFRFAQMAARRNIPVAAVNLGRTRADDLLALKVEDRCEAALSFLL